MRISVFMAALLLAGTILESDGFSVDGIVDSVKSTVSEWTTKLFAVDEKVFALFSPNVFEVYKYKLSNLSSIMKSEKFRKDRPTVIYIHGWLNDGEFQDSVMAIRGAYREQQDHNFIAIDWSAYSRFLPTTISLPYTSSIKKLREICIIIAAHLEVMRLDGYKNVYLAGHSLGGQCSGLVGRKVKEFSKGTYEIPKIYALDPAGPGFDFQMFLHVDGFDCISKNDAKYVEIIHTNGGKLGVRKRVGHSDFYPNGGETQPGCKIRTCSHSFAWVFYQQSIRKGPQFLALECTTYDEFEKDECAKNAVATMGYTESKTLPYGMYFLRTHSSKFGSALGEDGIRINNFTIIKDDGTKVVTEGFRPFEAEIDIEYEETHSETVETTTSVSYLTDDEVKAMCDRIKARKTVSYKNVETDLKEVRLEVDKERDELNTDIVKMIKKEDKLSYVETKIEEIKIEVTERRPHTRKELNRLQDLLTVLQEEYSGYRDQLNEADNYLTNKQNVLSKIQESLNRVQKQIYDGEHDKEQTEQFKEVEDKLITVQQELNKVLKEIVDYRRSIPQKYDLMDEIESSMNELQTTFNAILHEIIEGEGKKVDASKQEFEKVRSEVDFIDKSVRDIEKELSGVLGKVEAKDKGYDNIKMELNKFKERLSSQKSVYKESIFTDMQNELNEYQKELKHERSKLTGEEKMLNELLNLLVEREKALDKYQDQLTIYRDRFPNMQAEFNKVQAKFDEIPKKVNNMQEDLRNKRDDLPNKHKILNNIQNLINDMQKDLTTKKLAKPPIDSGKLKTEFEASMKVITELQVVVTKYVTTISQNFDRLIEIEKELSKMQKERSTASIKNSEEYNEVQEEFNKLQMEYSKIRDAIHEIDSQLLVRGQSFERLLDILTKIQKQITVAVSSMGSTKDEELENLQNELTRIQEEFNKVQRKITESRERISGKSNKLDNIESTMNSYRKELNIAHERIIKESQKPKIDDTTAESKQEFTNITTKVETIVKIVTVITNTTTTITSQIDVSTKESERIEKEIDIIKKTFFGTKSTDDKELEKVQIDLHDLLEQLKREQNNLLEEEKRVTELLKTLNEKKKEMEEFQQKLNIDREKFPNRQDEYNRLQQEFYDMLKAINDAQRLTNSKLEKILDKRKTLIDLQTEANKIQQEWTAKRLANRTVDYGRIKKEFEKTRRSLTDVQEEVARQVTKITESFNKTVRIEKVFVDMKNDKNLSNPKTSDELKKLLEQFNKIHKDYLNSRDSIHKTDTELTLLIKRLSEAQDTLNKARTEVTTILNKMRGEKDERFDNLLKEFTRFQEELNEVQKRISDNRGEISTKREQLDSFENTMTNYQGVIDEVQRKVIEIENNNKKETEESNKKFIKITTEVTTIKTEIKVIETQTTTTINEIKVSSKDSERVENEYGLLIKKFNSTKTNNDKELEEWQKNLNELQDLLKREQDRLSREEKVLSDILNQLNKKEIEMVKKQEELTKNRERFPNRQDEYNKLLNEFNEMKKKLNEMQKAASEKRDRLVEKRKNWIDLQSKFNDMQNALITRKEAISKRTLEYKSIEKYLNEARETFKSLQVQDNTLMKIVPENFDKLIVIGKELNKLNDEKSTSIPKTSDELENLQEKFSKLQKEYFGIRDATSKVEENLESQAKSFEKHLEETEKRITTIFKSLGGEKDDQIENLRKELTRIKEETTNEKRKIFDYCAKISDKFDYFDKIEKEMNSFQEELNVIHSEIVKKEKMAKQETEESNKLLMKIKTEVETIVKEVKVIKIETTTSFDKIEVDNSKELEVMGKEFHELKEKLNAIKSNEDELLLEIEKELNRLNEEIKRQQSGMSEEEKILKELTDRLNNKKKDMEQYQSKLIEYRSKFPNRQDEYNRLQQEFSEMQKMINEMQKDLNNRKDKHLEKVKILIDFENESHSIRESWIVKKETKPQQPTFDYENMNNELKRLRKVFRKVGDDVTFEVSSFTSKFGKLTDIEMEIDVIFNEFKFKRPGNLDSWKTLQVRVTRLQSEYVAVRDKMRATEDHFSLMQIEINKVQESYTNIRIRITNSVKDGQGNKSIQNLLKDFKDFEDELNRVQKDLHENRKMLSEKFETMIRIESSFSSYQIELTDIQQDLNNKDKNKLDLSDDDQREFDNIKIQINKFMMELQEIEREQDAALNKVTDRSRDLEYLQKQLEKLQRTLSDTKSSDQNVIKEIQEKLNTYQNELTIERNNLSTEEKTLTVLQTDLNIKQKELEQYKTYLVISHEKYSIKLKEFDIIYNEFAALCDNVGNLQERWKYKQDKLMKKEELITVVQILITEIQTQLYMKIFSKLNNSVDTLEPHDSFEDIELTTHGRREDLKNKYKKSRPITH